LKARAESAGSVHLRVRNVSGETLKSKLGALPVAGRVSLQDNADGSLSARVFPRDKSTRSDLAQSIAQTATQSGWNFDELHTEEGDGGDVRVFLLLVVVGAAGERVEAVPRRGAEHVDGGDGVAEFSVAERGTAQQA
jgi:hypothetical protein